MKNLSNAAITALGFTLMAAGIGFGYVWGKSKAQEIISKNS